MQNYRFLVTGGAGFKGSALVRHLAGLGASVRVVDNLVNGCRENLEGVLGTNVELTVADIRDRASMSSLLRDVGCRLSSRVSWRPLDSFARRE